MSIKYVMESYELLDFSVRPGAVFRRQGRFCMDSLAGTKSCLHQSMQLRPHRTRIGCLLVGSAYLINDLLLPRHHGVHICRH